MKHKFQLIALDLDGTCLTSSGVITHRLQHNLHSLKQHGILLVIATGRPLSGIPKEFQSGPLKASYFITLNGAQIYNCNETSPIYLQGLSSETLPLISKTVSDFPVLADFITGNVGYSLKSQYQHADRYLTNPHFLTYYQNSRIPIENQDWHQKLQNETSIEKCNLFFTSSSDLERFRSILPVLPHTNICSGMDYNLELTHTNATKGTALRWLSHLLSIPTSQILAIGDSENDKDMIHLAGMGIVMENAKDTVKQLADYVTTSNDQEGVSLALEQHFNFL